MTKHDSRSVLREKVEDMEKSAVEIDSKMADDNISISSEKSEEIVVQSKSITKSTHNIINNITEMEGQKSSHMDFSKAFDRVPNQRFLEKLRHYGERGHLYNWITDFLADRHQEVVLEGVHPRTTDEDLDGV